MNEGLVPRRYAKALYGFALEKGVAERVYTMMKNLTASFAANGGLQPTLANPYVGASDKEALLVTAAGADKTDSAFADFLKLLAENRRLDMARDIALAYIDIYRKANDIHEVKVTSAGGGVATQIAGGTSSGQERSCGIFDCSRSGAYRRLHCGRGQRASRCFPQQ